MKVAIEACVLQRKNKTGVDYYAKEILQSLISQMPDTVFELGYFSLIRKTRPSLNGKNLIFKPIPWLSWRIYNFFLRYFIAIPYDWAAGLQADLIFYPNFVRWPLVRIKKSIIVVYDTCFLDIPEFVAKRNKNYLSRFVPKSVQKTDHIITISESTKRSLIQHYGVMPSKITVINPAVDHKKYRPASQVKIQKIKKKYGIAKKYLLYLGTIEPRKNIIGIIKAYNNLPKKIKNQYQLVLAGGKGWFDGEIQNIINQSPQGQIVKTGYVDDEDKPALYSGAKIFLYPSFYEGWGMQILEAMACGTPVITADNSSLPEAGGKAALYVRAGADDQLKNKILYLLKDKTKYDNQVKQGLKQAHKFSWDNAGLQLKDVFEKVYNQR